MWNDFCINFIWNAVLAQFFRYIVTFRILCLLSAEELLHLKILKHSKAFIFRV